MLWRTGPIGRSALYQLLQQEDIWRNVAQAEQEHPGHHTFHSKENQRNTIYL